MQCTKTQCCFVPANTRHSRQNTLPPASTHLETAAISHTLQEPVLLLVLLVLLLLLRNGIMLWHAVLRAVGRRRAEQPGQAYTSCSCSIGLAARLVLKPAVVESQQEQQSSGSELVRKVNQGRNHGTRHCRL